MSKKEVELELENNEIVKAEVIFTFIENDEEYIFYEYNNNAYASKIDSDGKLYPIEKDEWKIVDKIYEQYQIDNKEKKEKE